MVVSFQENAWVDTPTHIHGLKSVLGPIDKHLEELEGEMRGLVLEDNLSTHLTKLFLACWENELKHFRPLEFLPVKQTDMLQVIDRHIGIIYKLAVYLTMRKEMMRRLHVARKSAGRACRPLRRADKNRNRAAASRLPNRE